MLFVRPYNVLQHFPVEVNVFKIDGYSGKSSLYIGKVVHSINTIKGK